MWQQPNSLCKTWVPKPAAVPTESPMPHPDMSCDRLQVICEHPKLKNPHCVLQWLGCVLPGSRGSLRGLPISIHYHDIDENKEATMSCGLCLSSISLKSDSRTTLGDAWVRLPRSLGPRSGLDPTRSDQPAGTSWNKFWSCIFSAGSVDSSSNSGNKPAPSSSKPSTCDFMNNQAYLEGRHA